MGLGPSAHSYNGYSRWWNVANNVKYTNSLRHHKIPFEKEVLTDVQCYNELVMTGIRTSSGIDVEKIKSLKNGFENYLNEEIRPMIDEGKIIQGENGNYVLKPEYYFFADGIAAELFFVSHQT